MTSSSELKVEDLLDLQGPSSLRISPDGSRVVYALASRAKKGENAVSALWTADIGREHSARQLTSGSSYDYSPEWSPDGTTIAFVSDRGAPGRSSAIYLLSMAGGEAYPVTESYYAVIYFFGWSPDGKFLAYACPDEKTPELKAADEWKSDAKVYGEDLAYNRLRVLCVSTREVTTLYSDNKHVIGAAWSPDSKSLAYVLSATPEIDSFFAKGTDVATVSVATKAHDGLFHFPGPIGGPLTWKENGLFFGAGVQPDKVCTAAMVYKYAIGSKTQKSWSKYAYGETDTAAGLQSFQGGIGVKVEAGLLELICVLDGPTLVSAEASLDYFDVHATESDEHVVVFTKESIGKPREVYSKSPGTDSFVQLSTHGHHLAPHDFGKYHALHCATFDGQTTLDGYYVTPSGTYSSVPAAKHAFPTYVAIHGGPTIRSTNMFDPTIYKWAPTLLNSGYGILVPNYRGSSSRGDAFVAPARGHVGTVDYDDMLAMVQEGIDQGFIDKDRIVVGGWSNGGFLSYLSAVRNGRKDFANGKPKDWRFRGAICGAGMTDWDTFSMTSDIAADGVQSAGTAPWLAGKESTLARRGSAIWEMSGSWADIPPLLMLHGERDERVPVSQAVGFHRGCLHYGVPCEFVVYPREPHLIAEHAHLVDMAKRVLRFCSVHLG